MDSLLLMYKKELVEEISIKENIVHQQLEKRDYISNILEELEDKFYDLMEQKIDLEDYLDYLENIDNSFIFESVLHNLIKQVKININNSNYMNRFYNELYNLTLYLRKVVNSKNTDILLKQQQIGKLRKIVENISIDGDFINPISEELVSDLIQETRSVKCDIIDLMREINLKNNIAIKRSLARQHATEIRNFRKKEFKSDVQELKNEILNLSNDEREIFERAKEIVKKDMPDTITEEESLFIKDLYSAKKVDDIENILCLMNSDFSSLNLIVLGLKHQIESSQGNKNLDLIKIYIDLYNKYIGKIDKLNEKNKKNQEIFYGLLQEFDDIVKVIDEDTEDIIKKLTDRQLTQLESFKGIQINDENKEQLNSTLKTVDLSVEFLLFYVDYNELNSMISSFNRTDSNSENIERIKKFLQLYDHYKNAKQNYIDCEECTMSEDMNVDENIVLYLTDDDNVTYVQRQIETDESLNQAEYNALTSLIQKIKVCNSAYIQLASNKVSPYTRDYKKRRLKQQNIRLIFIQVNRKLTNSNKNIIVVITAGKKSDSKNAPIYSMANHLKEKVIQYIHKLETLSDEEIQIIINNQKQIEEQLLYSISPKSTKQISMKK